jgi:DNA-binding NarL/FixJ family response regulator
MANKDYWVLIIEDDPFASDIIMMLLARDYRTHAIEEMSGKVKLENFDSGGRLSKEHIDVVILDTETPWNADLPFQIAEKLCSWENSPKILCTTTFPNIQTIKKFLNMNCFSGYLIKEEALYSLASAVCLAANGYFVITPGLCSSLEKEIGRSRFPADTLILRSPKMTDLYKGCTHLEQEIIRLGILFNLPDYEIHDELCCAESTVGNTMQDGRDVLQMPEIESGEVDLKKLFESPYLDNTKIINHYRETLEHLPENIERRKEKTGRSRFRNKSTLAFHLLTVPEIEKWD